MNEIIRERLARLRAVMAKKRVDVCLIPTADAHASEYVAPYFKAREYFCGFTGSNGTLVVSDSEAGLWTDGRYFIQAEKELEGTGVTLFRMADEGVPTINEYLKSHMQSGETLGFDGRVVSAYLAGTLEKDLSPIGVRFTYEDLPGLAWPERPALPLNDLFVVPDTLAGRSVAQKLADLRAKLGEVQADALFLSSLEDICWLFNIRGGDVACTPVALAYAWIDQNSALLFIQKKEVTAQADAHLAACGVEVREYDTAEEYLKKEIPAGLRILHDPHRTGVSFAGALGAAVAGENGALLAGENPTLLLKAVKNETELENIRRVYLADSAALTCFLYRVKKEAGTRPMTEVTAAEELDAMRAKLSGFIELSFPTISAYGANAAMMHYEAKEGDCADLKPEGFYLVDSGGTYEGGTTDVTRTIALGPVTQEMRRHFTAVVTGMLRLSAAHFLKGCTGRNLDILARGPLWDLDIDYKCGTGHGVGYMLSVHEGPHNIRWRRVAGEKEAELEAGMIVSDEPGVYLAGRYGIRIENILEVVKGAHNEDGQFLAFAMLTWVPIDLDAIDPTLMPPAERALLNAYHEEVCRRLTPLIDEEEIRVWLKEATRPI